MLATAALGAQGSVQIPQQILLWTQRGEPDRSAAPTAAGDPRTLTTSGQVILHKGLNP